jgi:hypothetical protein
MFSMIRQWSKQNMKEPSPTPLTFYDLHEDIWELSIEQKKIRKEIRKEKRIRETIQNEKQKKNEKQSEYDIHSDIWNRCRKDLEIRSALQNKLHKLHNDQLFLILYDIHHKRQNHMKIKDEEPKHNEATNELEQKVFLSHKQKPSSPTNKSEIQYTLLRDFSQLRKTTPKV